MCQEGEPVRRPPSCDWRLGKVKRSDLLRWEYCYLFVSFLRLLAFDFLKSISFFLFRCWCYFKRGLVEGSFA